MLILFSIIGLQYETGNHSFTLYAGKYNVTCKGAQGGQGYYNGILQSDGGQGAIAYGEMVITGTGTLFYANVGGKGCQGIQGPNAGGFNGGGHSGKDTASGGDDGSVGGSGATDLRIYDNNIGSRIIVAAGGSGGAGQCCGAPGGDLNGMYPTSDNVFAVSNSATQTNGNANGIGGDGVNSLYTPGSGGGGGWRGGPSSNDYSFLDRYSWKFVAHSGSSYISGYSGCMPNSKMNFTNGYMQVGGNSGDGALIINAIYTCSSNCIACTNGTECTQCNSDYLIHLGSCVSFCPEGYIAVGTKCESCTYPCIACKDSKTTCTKCASDFHLLGTKCYQTCPDGYGEDLTTGNCASCTQDNCINCSENKDICSACSDLYFVKDGKCVHYPSSFFTESKGFTYSEYFTYSLLFTKTDIFSLSSGFTNSLRFSNSNIFSESSDFTHSDAFSETASFTHSFLFTNSNAFSHSQNFTSSSSFTYSSDFSRSQNFTSSSSFTYSSAFSCSQNFASSSFAYSSTSRSFDFTKEFCNFTESKIFTKSQEFSRLFDFTMSNEFTKTAEFSKTIEFIQTLEFLRSEIYKVNWFIQ